MASNKMLLLALAFFALPAIAYDQQVGSVASSDGVEIRYEVSGEDRAGTGHLGVIWENTERFDGYLSELVIRTGDHVGADIGPQSADTGYVDVPGGRLYYESLGSGDAIVLIHGNIGDRRHWEKQFEALAADYRVIRYDVRGYGRSSLPREDESYSNVEDLAALLDQLNIPRAHLVGWSMGSGIAVDFALAHPERTRSLIPVGPWVNSYSSPELAAEFTAVSNALAEQGQPAAVDAFMNGPAFAEAIVDPRAGKRFREIATGYTFRGFTNTAVVQELKPAAVERLDEITVPTLIMTAEKDIPACLEIAELLHKSVKGSRMVVMKGTGHLLHMEKPVEFNNKLRGFLASVEE